MKQESFKVSKKKLFIKFILIFFVILFITVMFGLFFRFEIAYSINAAIILSVLISIIIGTRFKNDTLIISDEKIVLMSHHYRASNWDYSGTDSYVKRVVYKPYKVVEKLFCFIVIGKVEIIHCNDFLHDNQKHGIDGGNKLRIWKVFNNNASIKKLFNKWT